MNDYSYGPPPKDADDMVSLKVDNLTYRTTPDDLRRAFQKYGEVGDVYIPRDRSTRDSRGFAFVRYYSRRDADDAMDGLDGSLMDGRDIRVSLARHPRPLEPRGSYGRGGGGRYDGGGRSGGDYRSGPPRSRYGGGRSYRSRSRTPPRRDRRRSRSYSRSRSLSRSPR